MFTITNVVKDSREISGSSSRLFHVAGPQTMKVLTAATEV